LILPFGGFYSVRFNDGKTLLSFLNAICDDDFCGRLEILRSSGRSRPAFHRVLEQKNTPGFPSADPCYMQPDVTVRTSSELLDLTGGAE